MKVYTHLAVQLTVAEDVRRHDDVRRARIQILHGVVRADSTPHLRHVRHASVSGAVAVLLGSCGGVGGCIFNVTLLVKHGP